MRYSDKLMLVLSIGIACAMITRSVNTQEQFDATRTIVKGFEHRLSAAQTLKGRVLLRYINSERASYTQYNNNQATLNLLWSVKELGLVEHTHFISTTTGVYGAPELPIPEGTFPVEY